MSFGKIELLENEPIDNSIIKRDFSKNSQHQQANLDDRDQDVVFVFGENNNYHQTGNSSRQ